MVKSLKYETRVVKEIPKQATRSKGSKFDEILTNFLKVKDVEYWNVTVPDMKPAYLASQLGKRVKALKLDDKISIVTRKDDCYLEKKS